jgi:2-methylcitrate dehydratase PrpD
MTSLVPQLKPARVTVTLNDGRLATHACDSHRGDFQAPFTTAELREKFRELAGVVLTAEGAALVEQSVDHCDEWDNVEVLTALCRHHGRI